ncbi:hypothetical protein EDC04DRAFT_2609877 [Pisolithus marmoratus]|nr:hypothetical protein EDC04DRAFT_2609877 [Pisolithus marmoratus]
MPDGPQHSSQKVLPLAIGIGKALPTAPPMGEDARADSAGRNGRDGVSAKVVARDNDGAQGEPSQGHMEKHALALGTSSTCNKCNLQRMKCQPNPNGSAYCLAMMVGHDKRSIYNPKKCDALMKLPPLSAAASALLQSMTPWIAPIMGSSAPPPLQASTHAMIQAHMHTNIDPTGPLASAPPDQQPDPVTAIGHLEARLAHLEYQLQAQVCELNAELKQQKGLVRTLMREVEELQISMHGGEGKVKM